MFKKSMSKQSKIYVKNLPIEIKEKIFISNTLIVLMSAFKKKRNSYVHLIFWPNLLTF